MKALAVITARGGSKRIPRKNIKPFIGKPMIAYALKAALGCPFLDEVMVSTDDSEIAEIARAHGGNVPFMRSALTADDRATTADVLSEVHAEYAKRGKTWDAIVCIYPCVPFLTGGILTRAWQTFEKSGANALLPVVRYSTPIQRAFKITPQGFVAFREPDQAFVRTQDIEPMFHDAGMFYFVKTASFLKHRSVIVPGTVPFEMDEDKVQDIDTPKDWELAELKYRIFNNV